MACVSMAPRQNCRNTPSRSSVMAFRSFCLIFGNYAARKASNLVAFVGHRPEARLRETSADDSSANNRETGRPANQPADGKSLPVDSLRGARWTFHHPGRRLFHVDRRGSCNWIRGYVAGQRVATPRSPPTLHEISRLSCPPASETGPATRSHRGGIIIPRVCTDSCRLLSYQSIKRSVEPLAISPIVS